MNKNFINDCNSLLNSLSAMTGDNARVAHRLSEAVNRLEAVISQAEAQFTVGDSHATFNKEFIRNLNK
jgi:hypothetical protein